MARGADAPEVPAVAECYLAKRVFDGVKKNPMCTCVYFEIFNHRGGIILKLRVLPGITRGCFILVF